MLFSAATAVIGMLVLNGLPRPYNPLFNSDRFGRATDDGFFLHVGAGDGGRDDSAIADALFAGFSQTRRNEIRKALKKDLVEVKELETSEELDQMYAIHVEWCNRKGNPADTFEQMETAVSQRENRRTFIAKTDGKVIAGSFYRFCPGGMVEYAGNSSIPEYQRLRPNDLIGWYAIQWACGEDFTHFSMGGSHLFLRRFGGELIQTYRYRRDHSRLRLHDLREQTWELGLGVYKRLPPDVRANVKKVLVKQ